MARPETLRSTVGLAADVPRNVTVSMGGEYKRQTPSCRQQVDLAPQLHDLAVDVATLGCQAQERAPPKEEDYQRTRRSEHTIEPFGELQRHVAAERQGWRDEDCCPWTTPQPNGRHDYRPRQRKQQRRAENLGRGERILLDLCHAGPPNPPSGTRGSGSLNRSPQPAVRASRTAGS